MVGHRFGRLLMHHVIHYDTHIANLKKKNWPSADLATVTFWL